MAANGKRGTAIDAAAIPLADGGAEGGAAKGPPSGGRPSYHLGGRTAESLGNTGLFSSNMV